MAGEPLLGEEAGEGGAHRGKAARPAFLGVVPIGGNGSQQKGPASRRALGMNRGTIPP